MSQSPDIIFLPAWHCRRNRKINTYFDETGVAYTHILLESAVEVGG